jgi:hypothetical protein
LPFRDDAGRWRDILGALNLIEQFVDGMDFETSEADDKTKSAVERQILILSEAAKLLGKAAEDQCPTPRLEGPSRHGGHSPPRLSSSGRSDRLGYDSDRVARSEAVHCICC